jgi:CO dehydrogenase maturation factor
MEHISRRTNGYLDVLLLISDPSLKGIKTCKRLEDLIAKLGLDVKKTYLIINRVTNGAPPQIMEALEKMNLNLLGILPEDRNIVDYELKGIPMLNLEEGSPSVAKIDDILAKILP